MNKSLVERDEEKEVHCEAGRERFNFTGMPLEVPLDSGAYHQSPVTTIVNSSLDRS
ncbi:hypothetical protein Vi05172_g3738 [Venturia inaequalis]|nr:hypothetical protein Vi05172_g3738 [Venturia inaequalis]